jgi:hypothetical protein
VPSKSKITTSGQKPSGNRPAVPATCRATYAVGFTPVTSAL